MTEKLYGLDDIPEGCTLKHLIREWTGVNYIFTCEINKNTGSDRYVEVKVTPQLALHRAIQKARGEA